jgi:Domain of unknown function (DUF4262)
MCWLCDHPDATHIDYLEHIRGIIASCGFAVQGVEGDRHWAPWAYTVGLTGYGRPELLVTGLSYARSAQLLNDVAAHVLHAEAPKPGEVVPLVDGPVIEIVEVAEPTVHLAVAVDIYGFGIRALQLVHADDRGHWPWEVGFRGGRGGQPVLGVRASRQLSGGAASAG